MNNDVFAAILAMDAYNRGYGQGVQLVKGDTALLSNEIGRKLGLATILAQDMSTAATDTGFYAIAYQWQDSAGITHETISYRGTNPDTTSAEGFLQSPLVKDIWNGWRIAGGYDDASQAKLALSFAETVLGIRIDGSINTVGRPDSPVEVDFVGHSLGGGLAGYVSSLAKVGGSQTYLYDHMPYELAALAHSLGLAFRETCAKFNLDPASVSQSLGGSFLLDLVLNPIAAAGDAVTAARFIDQLVVNITTALPAFEGTATHIDGEVLSYLRDGLGPVLVGVGGPAASVTLSGLLSMIGLPGLGAALDAVGTSFALGTATSAEIDQFAYPNPVVLNVFGADLNAVERHSMALLTILEYADKQWADDARALKVNPSFWTATAKDFLPALQDGGIAGSLGLSKGNTGASDPGGQLAGIIAYSAIDEGERPFGDTGIRALFGDASELGRSYYALSRPQVLVNVGKDLGKLAVEYAGLLAYNAVMSANDPAATKGVLQYLKGNATRAETLTVDLRAATWTKGDAAHTPSVREALVADLLSGIDAHSVVSAEQWYGAVAHPGSTIAGDVDQIAFALSAGLKPGGVPGAPAGTGLAVSVLSDGGNTVDGAGGRDLIIGGTGDDIIFGGTGSDILIGGASPGSVWTGGFGNDQLHGGDGRDLLIAGGGYDVLYGDAGADTFLFDGTGQRAEFIGGAGNDIYDLRGSDGSADIVIYQGDGRDTLLSSADSFPFSSLRLTANNEIPSAPLSQIEVYLPDRTLADVSIYWQASKSDTHVTADGKIQLLHGHILIRDKATGQLIFDMGEFVGTKTTYKNSGNVSYAFADPRGPGIHFHDPSSVNHQSDFATIGDGVWPDLIVI